MPRIIKLGELLPADFVVELSEGGEQFTLPGDPPLELLLKIAELFERSENANGDAGEVGLEVLRELDGQMLHLLRMRQPELDASPFGVIGVQHVVASLLQAYNFAAVAEEPDEDPENPPPATRSKRSSGSRSSSTSSRSRRTTGAGSAGRSSKPGSG